MTNREWLNKLSNEELANWLCEVTYSQASSEKFTVPEYVYIDTRLQIK